MRAWLDDLAQHIAMKRAALIADWMLPFFSGDGPILDVGAGMGQLGFRIGELTRREVTFLDIGASPFTHPQVEVQLYDGVRLPFPDRSFDTVMSALVLHHADDPVAILHEMARVARRRVVIVEHHLRARRDFVREAAKDLLANLPFGNTHFPFQYHTEREWEWLFGQFGLTVIDKSCFAFGRILSYGHVGWALQVNGQSAPNS